VKDGTRKKAIRKMLWLRFYQAFTLQLFEDFMK